MSRRYARPQVLLLGLPQQEKEFLERGKDLVERGKISPDDAIRHFKEEFPQSPLTEKDLPKVVDLLVPRKK